MHEGGVGMDSMSVHAKMDFLERLNWKFLWTVEKWDQDVVEWVSRSLGVEVPTSHILRTVIVPDEVLQVESNLLLNEGIQLLLDLLIGAGGTVYSNANADMGVGDSSAAEVATQTDLQAAVNKLFKGMNATFPSRAAQTVTWQSDFTNAEANFAWNEASIRNGAAQNKNLNRKVVSLGTKASGTWTLSGAVTIS